MSSAPQNSPVLKIGMGVTSRPKSFEKKSMILTQDRDPRYPGGSHVANLVFSFVSIKVIKIDLQAKKGHSMQ